MRRANGLRLSVLLFSGPSKDGATSLHLIYKDTGNPLVGEVLQCERDPHNAVDQYSVFLLITLHSCPFLEHWSQE